MAETGSRAPLKVESEALAGSALQSIKDEWAALSARAAPSPYLTHGWLDSWATVYEPRGLLLLRISDADLGTVAVGLLEKLRFGRLRFAGGPVTPVRGLLADPLHEPRAWSALGEWLGGRRGWSLLDGIGVSEAASELPGAELTGVPWFGFSLPTSFETYLSDRPSSPRREFRRRLRVAEREGARTRKLDDAALRAGLDAFIKLHKARAKAKGEVHAIMDRRLADMLELVGKHGAPELRLFVVERQGAILAVGVQLNHGVETWAYNTGFDPAASRLSPGLLVRLASIRDAIERGGERFDLGAGDFAYKRDLGGEACDRLRIEVTNGSAAGRLVRLGVHSRHRIRRVGPLRTGVMAWRRMRRKRYARTRAD